MFLWDKEGEYWFVLFRFDLIDVRDDGNDFFWFVIVCVCEWIEEVCDCGGKILVYCVSKCYSINVW